MTGVELTHLSKTVQREVHPISSVDENLTKLKNSKVCSKLDANSGFWQITLDLESRLLTTVVTPFERFWFNRLPFGISSAPEISQRTMSGILERNFSQPSIRLLVHITDSSYSLQIPRRTLPLPSLQSHQTYLEFSGSWGWSIILENSSLD